MNTTTARRYGPWLTVFLFLGNCQSYHVSHNNNRIASIVTTIDIRPPARQQSQDAAATTSRRSFLVGCCVATTAWVQGRAAANAVDVVTPGEIEAKELKNRRIGGLAAKIRTVASIMVSIV